MKPLPWQVEPVLLPGLDLIARGKVCELYALPGRPHLCLKVFSDRASVHDIVLPFHVPGKGEVLNFIDHSWRQLFPDITHDVFAVGSVIDPYVPAHLRGDADLHRRARVIRWCKPLPVELIYRSLLTGTGLTKYRQNDGYVCGQKFPDGLKEWGELNPAAFTPTTKDPDGHDEHLDVQVFEKLFGREPAEFTRPVFERGRSIAAEREVIIVDTKFEVGKGPDSALFLIDEVLTPDSSRYLRSDDLEQARRIGKRPPSFDKQPIRGYVSKHLGVGADTPLTDEVLERVHTHTYPDDLIAETANRYRELLKLLTGVSADEYAAAL